MYLQVPIGNHQKKTNPTDMISSQITHYLAKQQVTTTYIVNVENYSSGILYFQM